MERLQLDVCFLFFFVLPSKNCEHVMKVILSVFRLVNCSIGSRMKWSKMNAI